MDSGTWTATLGSRRLELRWERTGRLTGVTRLLVDARTVGESAGKPLQRQAVITGGGVRVTLRRGWSGAPAEAVARPEGGDASREVAFAPPPGTRQARLARLPRERPGLYASRHVAVAAGKLALGVLGVGALLALIPMPDVPAIPFPDIPSPDIPWPDVSLPDWTPPGWLQAILDTSHWWAPVLVAVIVAIREARRRRRRTENAEREGAP
ncbi:MAG: hypothetical protein AB7O78_04560 [Thermoleophilia bacterium]